MATDHLIPADLRDRFPVKEGRNATGVLETACPNEWKDIQEVLREFRLYRSEVLVSGENRSLVSRRIDESLYQRGWKEKAFATAIEVDEVRVPSPAHAVDCLKSGVGLYQVAKTRTYSAARRHGRASPGHPRRSGK